MQYNLSALSVVGCDTIPIITGQQVALEKIPKEAYSDIMRMLAELAPAALAPKKEQFIIMMNCVECKESVESFFNLKGVVTCLPCMGYEI
jgi:hypothetical protein